MDIPLPSLKYSIIHCYIILYFFKFITHSAGKIDFYHNIERIDVEKEAGQRGIYARHWMEKSAAEQAHCFTTISGKISIIPEINRQI